MASGPAAGFPERHWYRRSALSYALWPASVAFGAVTAVRRALYRSGVARATRLPVPVVVVGNLVVGGAGKTPLVLWIVEALARRGFRPGIVSRGYGGGVTGPEEAPAGADYRRYGDEPVLLAERAGCPVWIGRDRPAAAHALLAAHRECDVIVSDDGLQHYRLARDVEIAVRDARGSGNGFLLPAGPLREPEHRTVDATVVNGGEGRYAMRVVPEGIRRVNDPGAQLPLESLGGLRLHAVAGIGHPQRFFDTLRGLGLDFVAHAFPDHHRYARQDLAFSDCDLVLMTEKDAVKCREFGRSDLAFLRVRAEVDPSLADLIVERIRGSQAA